MSEEKKNEVKQPAAKSDEKKEPRIPVKDQAQKRIELESNHQH